MIVRLSRIYDWGIDIGLSTIKSILLVSTATNWTIAMSHVVSNPKEGGKIFEAHFSVFGGLNIKAIIL